MPDLRSKIQNALNAFEEKPLKESALGLLAVLGYKSDRTLKLGSSKPKALVEFLNANSGGNQINDTKALVSDWKSADLLFQLTDNEISGQRALFDEHEVSPSLLKSYVFFAIELTGDVYARGKLTDIARQINRVFPMPVMVLIKHKANKSHVLSIAVINRRANKRDASKDVLGKVTIIRDVAFSETHRGHLDILDSFSIENLNHPQRLPINNFDNLHTAWEEVFNVELLNKRFYKELANWYFWALPQVKFPADVSEDDEKRRATSLIRLLTRLIFCWFLKEKGLVPESLFNETDLKFVLKELKSDSSSYYHAILQNLFFGTLNQRMGKDSKGNPYRTFAKDEGFHKNKNTYGVDNLYRYEDSFKDPEAALELFADIPFLNGGLFECLDRTDPNTEKKIYIDGFSRNKKKRPSVPNYLFFSDEQSGIDLSGAYGERSRRNEKVRGLIRILSSYKFTIVENTPIDQEIALDPELLGKVFENLLASYNEETKTTARKQTGSFYTPRPIVEYMVDESLKSYLTTALTESGMAEDVAKLGLETLFAYTEEPHPFDNRQSDKLLEAIHTCKILDPACGSGAFPMGMLQKLVYIIHKLDPANEKWQQLQIDKASEIPDSSARDAAIKAIEQDFADNEDDYGRKLYLIENCLYGVDIQPIAIQLSKLRFFISLVCDQKTNRSKRDNLGIRPLPNLETKFVAADTLIGLKKDAQLELFESVKVKRLESELQRVRHDHFAATTRQKKLALQARDREIRDELAKELEQEAFWEQSTARRLANWDPYDPQASADYFEPLWMFDRSLLDGFSIIIENPPYLSHDKLSESQKRELRDYEAWDPYADIYCYFLERSIRLLRNQGVIAAITSNSFLRADYGGAFRKFAARSVTTRALLSIDKSQVFDNAIVNVAVWLAQKSVSLPTTSFRAGRGSWDSSEFASYIGSKTYVVSQKALKRKVWSLSRDSEVEIVETIEKRGKSVHDHGAKIRLGLATGSNNAFLISPTQRQYFVKEQPSSESIIKPVIRGRDIERYAISDCEQYLILAKNGVNIPKAFPAIAKHLESFGAAFKSRGAQGENWWNLRACSFYGDFEVDRVVWIELTEKPRFAVCPAGVYMLNTAYFLLPPPRYSAYSLVGILNSSVSAYYMSHTAQTSGMGVTRWFKEHVSEIPLCEIDSGRSRAIDSLVHLRICTNSRASFLEDLIDACVMECYFREHMAERDLLFLDDLAPHLAKYDSKASDAKQNDFLEHLYRTLNAPDSPVRNRLLRLTADSPDLLAVIKAEGKV
jgi:adenine-specific DNA-methyltransferase